MIAFEQVYKRYPCGHEALQDVSFEVAQNEWVFLSGHSGAGKSTLLRLLALIERPTRGHIIVDGQNTARIPERKVPMYRRDVGMIFQDHQLLFDRRVLDNVALPLVVAGYRHHEVVRRAQAALDKVGLLSKRNLLPIMLSGGEQQRVGIARAIVNKPKILLADEPTGNLDPELSKEIMGLFKQFNEVGVTILIASHDTALIESLEHRIILLNQGAVQSDSQAGEDYAKAS